MIAGRLKTIMADTSQREFAKSLKISPSTLWEYLQDRVPPADFVVRICERYGISERWILTGKGNPHEKFDGPISDRVHVPLYNVEASAGAGRIPVDESVREYIPLKIAWLKAELRAGISGVLAVPVRGDSMHPTIDDGDLVLIEKTSEIRDDAIYVFRRGDVVQVKRLQALPGGSFEVISDNAMYKPYTVDPGQFPEYAIIGRVIWHGRNL